MGRKNRAVLVLALWAAIQAPGCAKEKLISPPSQQLRAEFEPLGLITDSEQSVKEPEEPAKGVGGAALAGAGEGALFSFAVPTIVGCGVGTAGAAAGGIGLLVCVAGVGTGVLLAPVGAIVGAGMGASMSHSAEEVEEAYQVFKQTVEGISPNEDLASEFRRKVAKNYDKQIVAVECWIGGSECTAEAGPTPKYAIRIAYSKFTFESRGSQIDPAIALAATVDAEIVRLADHKSVYNRQWGYRSESTNFFTLTKNEGAKLKQLLDESRDQLASAIVHDLLDQRSPAPAGEEGKDRIWTISGPLASD